jgi:hypothetical protein
MALSQKSTREAPSSPQAAALIALTFAGTLWQRSLAVTHTMNELHCDGDDNRNTRANHDNFQSKNRS